MIPSYWETAVAHLASDAVMSKLIQSYPGQTIRSRGNAFETLARSIVGQQISVLAAESVWRRVCDTVGDLAPEVIFDTAPAVLRSCGLSERKVSYLQDLAAHFVSGEIQPHLWSHESDATVIAELTRVKGIGVWTAEMFLMFHLLRPDIFPLQDLGLQKGLAKAYALSYPVENSVLEFYRRKFHPWASVATWYLWRSLDPIPVEY